MSFHLKHNYLILYLIHFDTHGPPQSTNQRKNNYSLKLLILIHIPLQENKLNVSSDLMANGSVICRKILFSHFTV